MRCFSVLVSDVSYCFKMPIFVWFDIHSELIAIQQSHCLGSSKSALREDEKLIDSLNHLSLILLVNKDTALPSERFVFH